MIRLLKIKLSITAFLLGLFLFLPAPAQAACLVPDYCLNYDPDSQGLTCYDSGSQFCNLHSTFVNPKESDPFYPGKLLLGPYMGTVFCTKSDCEAAKADILKKGFCNISKDPTSDTPNCVSGSSHLIVGKNSCVGATKLFSSYNACLKNRVACGNTTCEGKQVCINKQCFSPAEEYGSNAECHEKCKEIQKGEAECIKNTCYLRGAALAKYNQTPTLLGEKLTTELKPPTLNIRIPQLTFTDLQQNLTQGEDGHVYLQIPWIGQYITALYRFSLVAISITAIIMLIIQGLRIIVSGGGEAKMTAYKKIGQISIGLVIAWGSYVLLYNINPELVEFKALRVRYIENIDISDLVFDRPMNDFFATLGDNSNPYKTYSIPNKADLDPIFKAYAACYGMDWRVLKAIAAVESSLNPNTHTPRSARHPRGKYQGLFQMTQGYCNRGISMGGGHPFSLELNCADRFNPETNTAAGAAVINRNLGRILDKCPTASVQDALLLLYVSHNNGPAVMNHAINNGGCNGDKIRLGVRDFYDSRGGSFRTVTTNWGERKYKYGFKVVTAAQKIGVTELYPSGVDRSICPKKTGKKVFQER